MTAAAWRHAYAPLLAVMGGWCLLQEQAGAAQWTLDGNLQASAESNDNIGLSAQSPASSQRLTLRAGMAAARLVEISSTRLNALVLLPYGTATQGREWQSQLNLTSNWTVPLNNFGLTLDLAHDDNQGSQRTASDVLIGRARRNTMSAATTWSHQHSERLSSQAGYTYSGSRYAGDGTDRAGFRNHTVSASVAYRWDELLSLSLQGSRSRYGQTAGDNSSLSDDLKLSASRSLDEISSLSLSVGRYGTRRSVTLRGLVCPLDVSFCSAGLVAPVPVQQDVSQRSGGSQYSLNYNRAVNERAGFSLSLSRQLAPGAGGVFSSDSGNASLNLAFSPTLQGSAALSHTRSRTPGDAAAPRPQLSTLNLGLSWGLAERLSLSAGTVLRRFQEPTTHLRARSAEFSITLQYQAPTIWTQR